MRLFVSSFVLLASAVTWARGESNAQVLVTNRGQPLPPGMEPPPIPHFPTANALPEMDPLLRAAQLRLEPTAAPFAFEFSPTPSGRQLQTLSSRQDSLVVVSQTWKGKGKLRNSQLYSLNTAFLFLLLHMQPNEQHNTPCVNFRSLNVNSHA